MSGTQRPTLPAVIARLLSHPQDWGLHQAVRLLGRWLGGLDKLHFRNNLSLAFPCGEVASVQVHGADAPEPVSRVDITLTSVGLLGVGGALPWAHTELLGQAEAQHKDEAARAFLDVFQDRAMALDYLAWRHHRLPLRYEADRHQAFVPVLHALAGVPSQTGALSDAALAFHAGLLQQRRWPVHRVQCLLQHELGVPVRIESWVPSWMALPPDPCGRLQGHAGHRSDRALLGRSLWLGPRLLHFDRCVRIELGPMGREAWLRFLRRGEGLAVLTQWWRLLGGWVIDAEVCPRLARSDRAPLRLACLSWDAASPGLGQGAFLLTGPARSDGCVLKHRIGLGAQSSSTNMASAHQSLAAV